MRKTFILAASAAPLILTSIANAEDLSFKLVNESPSPITGFYVSSENNRSWEQNLLSGGILDVDYEVDVIIADGLSTCVYDIRAEFQDGEALEDYGLDLCDLGSYVFE
ncbi:hypothetical protein [Hoeflea poritis]|uniref:Argininosuccinate lyase n=1 Tax=Hoeflea poritis TaxID=2993659 RepID=A0ABT4VSY4_9HYPH|nr:hypothetical protein [Hoeflea poritis]MDA4847719.1 hypothetical protein [Hoeflea poritis]